MTKKTVATSPKPAQTRPKFDSEEKRIADNEAFWNLENNALVRDMSHIRGCGRWIEDKNVWENVGGFYINILRKIMDVYPECNFNFNSAAEYGSGGGLNIIQMAPYAKRLYAIDISKPNLGDCQKTVLASGVAKSRFFPIKIKSPNPESCLNAMEKLDFFFSLAVFHHLPSEAYAKRVVKIAYQSLKPRSYAVINIRYWDGRPELKSKLNHYMKNGLNMVAHRISEFYDIVMQAGFTCHYHYTLHQQNFAYFYLRKDK